MPLVAEKNAQRWRKIAINVLSAGKTGYYFAIGFLKIATKVKVLAMQNTKAACTDLLREFYPTALA